MLTQRQSTICELVFPSAILGVRLNRRRLVAVLDAALHIYDISNMKILHAIDTGPNPKGLCAMTSSSEPCYAAYPADVPSERGGPASSVVIYNLDEFAMVNVVHAHRARIAFLALNAAGTMLATASEKGTVVRVFPCPTAAFCTSFGGDLIRHASAASRLMPQAPCCASRATRILSTFSAWPCHVRMH